MLSMDIGDVGKVRDRYTKWGEKSEWQWAKPAPTVFFSSAGARDRVSAVANEGDKK